MQCVHRLKLIRKFFRNYSYDLYEPDYLEAMKSKIPLYDLLNIQLRGYDYSVLESFQSLVHSTAKKLDIPVEDGWSIPAQELQIMKYKPYSSVVDAQYNLKMYQRTLQISDVSGPQLSVLLRALENITPPGVTAEVVAHEDYHQEIRYVPDLELKSLKQQLEDMGGSRKK